MRLVGESNEHEMVWCFLSAEYHSPRFKQVIRQLLGNAASLLVNPNLTDEERERRSEASPFAIQGIWRGHASFRWLPLRC